MIGRAVPLEPTAEEARRLVLDELAKPEYRQAQPNWLDRLASGFVDWLQTLAFPAAGGPPWALLVVLAIALIVGLGLAFLIFGVPRWNTRSAVAGSLFGENDDRTGAEMRAAAGRAADAEEFALAIAELFRALATSLAGRTVLTLSPGTTAHTFAGRAARAFPASADELAAAATTFDAVRYLGREGSRREYERLLALDRAIAAASPVLETVTA